MADGYIDFSPVINAIERVDRKVSVVNSNLTAVGENVDVIDGKLSSTQDELAELRRQFEEYVKQAERTVNV